ncbi:LOW QUALITY PROTEIN: uncharacterized protein LOC129226909 [Uloborus diversus]|uniref:LOW QUALITY PROTEIN: uncharacterized protein LOC129226909 n=1 Tax=Uloborus diversus TaxID=327109 RepID=UPI0024093533|nr:LOW QUALITY PROTEIN: uncharacterized protein LOC129226909 [Uloborus diversus]
MKIKDHSSLDLLEDNENTAAGKCTKAGESSGEIKIDIQEDNENSDDEETTEQPRRSGRKNKGIPPDRFAYTTNIQKITEPKNWKELEDIKNPYEKAKWLEAIEDEIKSINKNNTWELVNPPQGKKIIGCKHPLQNNWSVDVKPNALGNVFIWNIQNEEKVTAVPEICLSNQVSPGQYKLQLKVVNGLGYLQESMIFEAAVALLLLNYTITDFFVNEYGVITLHINQIMPVPDVFIDFGDNITCHLDLEECNFEYEAVEGALVVNIAYMYTSSGVYDVYFNASSFYGAFEQSDTVIVEEHISDVDLILLSPTLVSLFEKVIVMCTVKNGTNLNFEWDFGEYMDDQYTIVHSFAKNSTAYHSYGIADVYNISVTVYNNYEEITIFLNQSIQAVEEIKDLHLQPLSGFYAVPLHASRSDSEVDSGHDYATDPVKFKASVWRGSDVQFLFDFGDGTTELVPSQPPLWDFSYAVVKHTYFSDGVYEVYVTATNLLDSVKTKLDLPFYVQFAPEGLKLNKLYYIVEYGSNLTLQASLTRGTNVSFNWHIGDEYFTNIGDTLFLQDINPGIYEVIVEAYNEVTDFSSKYLNRPSFSSKIYVQERLQAIEVCLIVNETEMCGSTTLELASDETVVFKAKTTPSTESYLRFIWQLGIGELKRTNSPYLKHQYQHAGWYRVNVTAQNHISSVSSLVLHLHLVQKIANLTSIHSQGPNLVNYQLFYSVFYWFGTNLTFQWDFGDGSLPVTTNTSSVSHTYKKLNIYCSDCHKFGVNQDNAVRFKASCSNCEESTTKYSWKIWVIEDSAYRLHFSNYECVQADGSTFFIMAPNSTSDTSPTNVSFVQNDEESFTLDHISKDRNASEEFPPFPSLPEFPEDPKMFQVDPEFLPNPVPDLLNPDYLITEEGLPGEGGSAAARHQSSHRFGLDENTIFEGAGMPRTKSSDDYNALENDLFSFGDPVRDNTVDLKLPPPHLVNRPKTLLSLNMADTTTGFNSDTLILKPGILKVGHSYLAQVNAINKDNNQEGFAVEYFKVHVGPINGRCTLMPLSGYSLNFDFRLHCLEWKTDHSPLYYEIRYSFKEEEAGHLIYFGLNENIRFTLPAGHEHNSYHVFLNVLVRDNVGAPTKVCSLDREVKPLPLNTSMVQYVYNETFHPRSILKKLLGEKHNQAALHQIHVLVSSLNNANEHGELALNSKDQKLQKKIIHSLLDCMNDLKIATKVEATQMLSVLSEIISSKQAINLFEIQKAYNIFDKLKKQREALYNFFATELFKHGFLTFLSKLAFAANSKLVKNAELINIAREHMLEEIIAIMRNRLKTEEPVSIRTPHSYISAVYISEENKLLPNCSVPEITAYSIPLRWDLLLVPNIELLETEFNPFPAIVFVTLFIIYCLCIFLNFQRKRNVRLPCVPVSLKDNCTDHKQLYLIYVSTGMFSSSGTTASVFIVLHGAKGVTETRQLIGSDYECISFQKGSVDTFLLSTQDNLGPLMKIEVWHNNYGPSPSWYLNNIVIKDVKTEEYYHFNCYNWLAVEKDDGKIERELPIMENSLTFKQILYRNIVTFIYDFNMWNVLYFESPTSYFTSCQRLTCCLCSCVNIALLLCIFQRDILTELDKYDILHMTWETLILCFYVSAAAAVPQLIYTTLFRFSMPPPVTLDPEFSNIFHSLSLDSFNCWLKNKLSNSSSTTDRSSMEDSNSLYSSERSSSLSVPDVLDESFSSIEKDALEFSVAFSDVSESVSPLQNISSTWQVCESWLRKKHNVISNYDLTPSDGQLSGTDKQNDDILLDEFSIGDPDNQMEAVVENIDEVSAASNSNLTTGTQEKNSLLCDSVPQDEYLNAQFLFPTLPSFFYYAAWWILVGNTLASAFVTLQYSSRFSTSFCIYWLQCVFIAVLCSCLMITPILIFLMVFIYSIKCHYLSKVQVPRSSEDSSSNKAQSWYFGSQPSFARMEYFKKYLRPPREQILEQFRRYCIKEKIMFSFYSETSQFLFIFVLLLFLMLPEDTNERYQHRRAIQNAFSKPKNFFWKHAHHSKEAVWNWLEKDFLNGFYGSTDSFYDDQEYGIEFSTSSRLVGTSILKYYNSSSSCGALCSSVFGDGQHVRNDSHRHNFHEEKLLDGSYGQYFISRSSNLSSVKFDGMDQIQNLVNWLNLPSVAASIEFMLFNPVFSLLTSVSFLLEASPQGTITMHLDTPSVKLSDITNTSYHLKFIVLLIYFYVTAFKCKNHLWKILKNKSEYQKDKWNFHECTFLGTSILYIVFYVCYLLEFNHTVNKLKVTQLELNIDIERIIYFETAIRSFNAILVFLHLIRSFKILCFSSRLQRILKKLSCSWREICTLFFVLLVLTFILNIVAKQCAFMDTISPHPLLICLKSIDSLFPDHSRSEILHSESIIRRSLYFFISLFILIIHVYLFSFIRSVLITYRGAKMQSYEKIRIKDSVQMIKRRCLQHFQPHTPQIVDEADFELPVDFLLMKLERIADILVAKADVLFPNQDESYKNEICDTFITEILEDFTMPCVQETEMPLKSETDEKKDLDIIFQDCGALNIEKVQCRLIATMPRQSKPKPRAYLPTSFHSSLNSERRFKNNSGTIDVSVFSQHKIRKTYPLFHIDSDSSSQTSSDQKKNSFNNCSIRKTKSRGKGKSDVLDVFCDST